MIEGPEEVEAAVNVGYAGCEGPAEAVEPDVN